MIISSITLAFWQFWQNSIFKIHYQLYLILDFFSLVFSLTACISKHWNSVQQPELRTLVKQAQQLGRSLCKIRKRSSGALSPWAQPGQLGPVKIVVCMPDAYDYHQCHTNSAYQKIRPLKQLLCKEVEVEQKKLPLAKFLNRHSSKSI